MSTQYKGNPTKGTFQCRTCKEVKDISMFHKSKNMPYGVQIYCKPCRKEIDLKNYSKKLGVL